MFASRASAERPLTSRSSAFDSILTWLGQARLAHDLRWVIGVGLTYALAVIAAVLSLHRYFAQTWDVVTFAAAARSFWSADWAGVYAATRAAQTWPYAYPPLHAALIAPLLALDGLVPDWLLVRLPPLLADIGVGLLVYTLVARATASRNLARMGLVAWLLNPVTFYDTAVQGHFEAEWLFFVLLAYLLADSRRGLVTASLALAVAFLFKQVAILFAIPFWLSLALPLQEKGARGFCRLVVSGIIFGIPVLLVSLPFLLYSSDYLYMNLQYVAEVPLQTQSWLVALAGLFGGGFWPLQHSTLLVALAAVAISFVARRRGLSLYRSAALIALAFFLLSQKVMGYYYVMLLPFALVELIPARRFRMLSLIIALAAWISLSPYFASWADQAHWPAYAALGTLNSLLWLATALALFRMPASGQAAGGRDAAAWCLPVLSILLFVQALAAALVQPLVNNPTSPIRAPLVPPELAARSLAAFGLALAIALAAAAILWLFARRGPYAGVPPRFAFLLALVYLPLYFLTFSLTKESTAAFELLLKSLGYKA